MKRARNQLLRKRDVAVDRAYELRNGKVNQKSEFSSRSSLPLRNCM